MVPLRTMKYNNILIWVDRGEAFEEAWNSSHKYAKLFNGREEIRSAEEEVASNLILSRVPPTPAPDNYLNRNIYCHNPVEGTTEYHR